MSDDGQPAATDPATARGPVEGSVPVLGLERRLAACVDALSRARTEISNLADNVPAFYAYVDADGRYRFVNRRYAEMFHQPVEAIVGQTMEQLLGPDYEDARGHVERALAGETVFYEGSFTVAGHTFTLQVSLTPDTDAGGGVLGFFALVNDVTELKRKEQAIRESEERLQTVMRTAPEAIVVTDRRGIIESFNRAAERRFGYTAAEVLNRNVTLLMPAPHRHHHDGYLLHYLKRRQSAILGRPLATRGRRKDGSIFPLEVTVGEIDHKGLFVAILRDVSERRALERDVAEASTFEQERIGREIHDGIGQKLTALSMLVASLKRDLERRGAPEVAAVGRISDTVQQAMSDARALSRGLIPIPLVDDGLAAAFNHLAETTCQSMGVSCHFWLQGMERVTNDDRMLLTQLYRIGQEAVHNAARHAGARHIRIRLTGPDSHPTLTVSDDGKGFDVGGQTGSNGLGLRIMRYRAGVIDYRLVIDSRPGEGTTVRAVYVGDDGEDLE